MSEQLPKWPDREKYVTPTPYGEGMTMAQIADYEHDRADAAMAYLRFAVEALRSIAGPTRVDGEYLNRKFYAGVILGIIGEMPE